MAMTDNQLVITPEKRQAFKKAILRLQFIQHYIYSSRTHLHYYFVFCDENKLTEMSRS